MIDNPSLVPNDTHFAENIYIPKRILCQQLWCMGVSYSFDIDSSLAKAFQGNHIQHCNLSVLKCSVLMLL